MRKYLIIAISIFLASCSNLEEMNVDVKNPVAVPGATLFSNAEKNLASQAASINVNTNNFNLWSQYITETTYTDEANFDIVNRAVPDNAWATYYRDILKDLQESEKILAAEEYVLASDVAAQKNRLAIIDLVRSYTYYRMLSIWGNIPYTDALKDDIVAPAYDDALTVYKALLTNIGTDLANMDATNGSFDAGSDLIYDGDVEAWTKFANTLKVKIAITLADVSSESALVKSTIESAVSAGVFTSNADDAKFVFLDASPNTNPVWVDLIASGRKDFVSCKTFGDVLNTLNDPRRPFFYKDLNTGAVNGAVYGASSPYAGFSHLSEIMEDPTWACTLLSYSEVEFYLAEAAERGYSVGGTATAHYNNGVTASILSWGGSTTDATDYLAQASVDYATATGTWQEKIATQAWISFFMRGFEAWTEYRRLDYPVLPLPATTAFTSYAVRYTYPINEQTLNGTSYTAAAATVNGGDKITSKLFWDIH